LRIAETVAAVQESRGPEKRASTYKLAVTSPVQCVRAASSVVVVLKIKVEFGIGGVLAKDEFDST
jgi:hypothetical protein